MKLLLVVNPAASSVTPRVQVLVQRALGEGHDVTVAETTRRNHATRLAEDAARRSFGGVVVLGGDGTVNEAANGLAHSDTALIPLPGGSTNVFCRTLSLPDDPTKAVVQSLAAIEQGAIDTVGLGSVNQRFFLFHTGIGFDAAVVEQVERQGDLKRYLNHPLFVYAALKTWLRHYDRSTPAYRIDHHDGTPPSDGFISIVLNTDPYTYLGNLPLQLSPETTLDTGLGCVTLTSLRPDRLLRLVADSLRPPAGIGESPIVQARANMARLRFDAYRPVPVQVDGDFIGNHQHLEITHHPNVLRLARTDKLAR